MSPVRIAAFVEHVLRPLTDDLKQILAQLSTLGFQYDSETFMAVARQVAFCHLGLEVFRSAVSIILTSIVCWTAWSTLR